MADIKTNYVWSFDLVENTMIKDVKEDFVASVRTQKSMTIDDIAIQIALFMISEETASCMSL